MVVGGIGTLLNALILYGLVACFNWHHLIAPIVSFVVVVCVNYLLNSRFTFNDRNTTNKSFIVYVAVSALSYPVYFLFYWLLTDVIGIWYIASSILAIIIRFTFNYIGSNKFAWGS